MRLEQLADFFASVLVGLEVAMVTLALAVGGTFTGGVRCQNCFFPKLSRTLRLLVVEFEIIMVITHE